MIKITDVENLDRKIYNNNH